MWPEIGARRGGLPRDGERVAGIQASVALALGTVGAVSGLDNVPKHPQPRPARGEAGKSCLRTPRRSAVRPGVCARRRHRLPSPPPRARAPPSPTGFGVFDSSDRPTYMRPFFLSRPWNTRAGRWSVGGSSFLEANATCHPGPS
jgi:hypothetical protein